MRYIASEKRYTDMVYRNVGESGLKLPVVSLGLWHNFGSNANYDDMANLCMCAFDNGITHFDLANNYGPVPGSAEENFGRILKNEFSSYRDELIISTKAGYSMWEGPYGDFGSKKHIIASLNQSLKRLQLDYVDIFYHHRMDKNTPLEETMLALSQIVNSGKALYVGLSNYDGETMAEASKILNELKCPFIINQNKYSIFDRTIESNNLINESKNHKKGIIAFSPLAQGLLSNKYLDGIPQDSRINLDGRYLTKDALDKQTLDKISKLNELAISRNQSLAQMALAFVLNNDALTSVLIGASKTSQIIENVKTINNLTFSNEELDKIQQICN